MKYIYGTILTLTVMLLTLTGCNSESTGQETVQPQRLLIDATVGKGGATRTVTTDLQSTSIVEGGSVGAFIYRKGTTVETAPAEDDIENPGQTKASYGYTNKKLSSISGTNRLYSTAQPIFPEKGSGDQLKVDIYAYAPYDAAYSSLTTQIFAVKDDQSKETDYIASDLLYAKQTGVARANDGTGFKEVPLTFDHMLTKLIIELEQGDGTGSLAGATVELINVGTTGTIKLTDGTVTINNSGSAQTGTVSVFKYGYKKNADDTETADNTCTKGAVVVYPHTAAELANAKVRIKMPGGTTTYTASLATTNITELDAKNSYTYKVRVSADGITFSAAISPWTEEAERPVVSDLQ